MTSKKFFAITIIFFMTFFFMIVGVNYYMDDFGLFRSHSERRIWAREKTSKYLMSFKYIPENFDAVLVGSSVSANLDTSILSGYEVYNLSMNSGNMTELKYPLEVLARSGKIKAVIFCLYDYTTKNSGVKGNQVDKKEYFGSLFSDIPFELLKYKLKYKIMNKGIDVFHKSYSGFNDFNLTKKNINFINFSVKYMKDPRKTLKIDPVAFDELKQTVMILRKNNIKIYGYFYPIYKEWFNVLEQNGEWNKYKIKIQSVFDQDNDVIWDMNEECYDYITEDTECYSDGHLSNKGADEVLAVVDSIIAYSKSWNH